MTDRVVWHKSAESGANGCVEVAFIGGRVAVRDSKNQKGPVLTFTATEWRAFLRSACRGEFDPPVGESGAGR
jgi:hypothetical protein